MKNLLLSTLLICLCASSVAQDLMVLKDATEMEVKITEIREREIAYKKWDFQDGPVMENLAFNAGDSGSIPC